ncbi:MAG: hypothetical protein HQK81_06440 [Desulfovibrionaceae bacterium]|nr:hypothetical protein [Desulfovibrionaceae bacterium]MBF0513687.1 hypothetical protein [Desulfovibrionaceae bacterium]
MPRIDIKKLRRECQRILAYTEGLALDSLELDTSLGDAVSLRVKRLYELVRAGDGPGETGAAHAGKTAAKRHAPLFTQIEPAGEPGESAYVHTDVLRADIELLRRELTAAQTKIAELDAAATRPDRTKNREPQTRPPDDSPKSLHLRVLPPPQPLAPEDENMTFLGLAKK